MDRADIVHVNFRRPVAAGDLPSGAAPSGPLSAAIEAPRSAKRILIVDETRRTSGIK